MTSVPHLRSDFVVMPQGSAYWDLREPYWTWDTIARCAVLFRDGTAVSVIRLFDRTLHTGGVALTAAGIGGVYTHESYRGQGFASDLLRYVCSWLRDHSDAAVACLYARDGRLYEREGFVAVRSCGKQQRLYVRSLRAGLAMLQPKAPATWRMPDGGGRF